MKNKGKLANRLRASRLKAEMTQVELAAKAGVSQSLVTQIERDIIKSTESLAVLALALGVDPEWLRGDKKDAKKVLA